MPAASFPEVPIDQSAAPAVRLHAIGRRQCRWIVADEDAGADALMCGAPAEPRRPFCAAHCARAYLKTAPDEAAEIAELDEAKSAELEEAERKAAE